MINKGSQRVRTSPEPASRLFSHAVLAALAAFQITTRFYSAATFERHVVRCPTSILTSFMSAQSLNLIAACQCVLLEYVNCRCARRVLSLSCWLANFEWFLAWAERVALWSSRCIFRLYPLEQPAEKLPRVLKVLSQLRSPASDYLASSGGWFTHSAHWG